MPAHWLRSEEGFSGLPRTATDREDDRGTRGLGRATIRGSCQAPELRETEFNALSSHPLTHCLFAACAVLVPPHFSSYPADPDLVLTGKPVGCSGLAPSPCHG